VKGILHLKQLIYHWLPADIKSWLDRRRIEREEAFNKKSSVEKVFTSIYVQHKWGGTSTQFSSGSGSSTERISSAYVGKIRELAQCEGFEGLTFADLGCGDFRVGRQLLPLCSRYVGIDVVRPLVEHLRKQFGTDKTVFLHSNILVDPLPIGEVCFIRQVLQHLSNNEILAVLSRIGQYKWVFITEHYPYRGTIGLVPNLDKVHGANTRLELGSAVVLDEPPFCLPRNSLRMVLEVEADAFSVDKNPGYIRTFLYKT
jgi:hypothetical protein